MFARFEVNIPDFFDFLIFFCWHKLKIQLQEGTQNTTNLGKPMLPKWKSRNNTHMRPI